MQVPRWLRAHRRLTTYVGAAVVVLVLAAVAALQPWGSSGSDSGPSAAQPPTSPGASPQDPEELLDSADATSPVGRDAPPDSDTAKDVVTTWLVQSSDLLASVSPDGNTDVSALRSLATGAALGELLAQVQEFEVEDWQQRGKPVVVWSRVVAKRSTEDRLFVKACIDTSSISIRDANGIRIMGREAGRRDVNHYLLQRTDQGWKVAEHSFPARTDC